MYEIKVTDEVMLLTWPGLVMITRLVLPVRRLLNEHRLISQAPHCLLEISTAKEKLI